MRWVIDETGRFRWRPYYDQEELDIECERIVSGFMKRKYGEINFPISTDDLTVMIEQDTSELDLYADISGEGEDIEGLTDFFPHKKPVVKISKELSIGDGKHHRLRTTLAHEYGHVKFHTFLWEYNQTGKSTLNLAKKLSIQRRKYNNFRKKYLHESETKAILRCKQSRVLTAPYSDWMEWQATYACGAFLIPLSVMRNLFLAKKKEWGILNWISSESERAMEMTNLVSNTFDVSSDAARIRLLKLGYLQKDILG
jgi:hypothetical protein